MKKQEETIVATKTEEDSLLVLLDKPYKATSIAEEEIEKLKSSLGNALKLISQLEDRIRRVDEDMKYRTEYLLNKGANDTTRDSRDSRRMAEYAYSPKRICPVCGDPNCPRGHRY